MPGDEEIVELRRTVLSKPGEAFTTQDGRLLISFDGQEVVIYQGPDFNAMTLEKINEYIARMDQK